ncbi:MAG: ABC transporter permease [Christensenellaceae bacterium]|jgi:spermidine/putrescine transport system permease protein|nr:ABC transporter permease [Christensenellaceae bacterium]
MKKIASGNILAANIKKAGLSIKNFRLTRSAFAFPYVVFMLVFIIVPLFLLLSNAFTVTDAVSGDKSFSFDNFKSFANDGSSVKTLSLSLIYGVVTTGLCIIIGYPAAFVLSKLSSGKLLLILFLVPMWINFLIRTLATRAMFTLLNVELGTGTVIFGLVYNYLPFMILPIHTSLTSIDKAYGEASADLGASSIQTFIKVNFPLSIPGLVSGITMVFIPTITTFAVTELLGGVWLFGDSIYSKFKSVNLYGVGSVMSLIMLVFVLVSDMAMRKVNKGEVARNVI